MNNSKSIESEIIRLNIFQTITRAYTEIAAIRMRKTKDSVLLNRDFMSSLDDVFTDVRLSYAREMLKLGSKKKGEKGITFLAHNGKTVAVFLSANTGLYGDIIERTFKLFLEEVMADPKNIEVTIVGSLGLSLFQSAAPNHPYSYFEISDTNVTPSEISQLIGHVVQYEEIRVYYPTFQSAINQKPTRYSISAQTPLSELKRKSDRKDSYLFEPSLKEILVFFERETFSSLLDQSIRESQLAKYAARIMTLDRAGENIKSDLKTLNLDKMRVDHRLKNRKQLSALSSISMW